MAAAKPAVVGGFVLGALLIAIVAALVLGGMRWFSPTMHAMVVFKGSVAGLSAGSPVTFRGVAIGKVQFIEVRVRTADHAPVVEVHLDLEPDRLSWVNRSPGYAQDNLKDAVQAGLRAQLISQSLVTGELNVDLDFYPNLPAVRVITQDSELQIPTIPSELQTFKDQVREMNLPDIASKTRVALVSLQQDLDALNGMIGPITGEFQSTLRATTSAVSALDRHSTQTLDRIDELAVASQHQITANGDQLQQLLESGRRTTAEAEQLIASLNELAAPRSAMREDLEATLRDLAATSSSLRLFTHDLERDPAWTLLRRSSP